MATLPLLVINHAIITLSNHAEPIVIFPYLSTGQREPSMIHWTSMSSFKSQRNECVIQSQDTKWICHIKSPGVMRWRPPELLASDSCRDSKPGQNAFHCWDCDSTIPQKPSHVTQEAHRFLPAVVFWSFAFNISSL